MVDIAALLAAYDAQMRMPTGAVPTGVTYEYDGPIPRIVGGHASAAMTLDQYGHLFGDRLDEVAERMAAAREAAVARVLPEAEIIDLDDGRRSGVSLLRPGASGSAPGRIRTCAPASGGRCSIP